MQVIAMHRGAAVDVRVEHNRAVRQHMLVFMAVRVRVFSVSVAIVVMAVVAVRMAVNRAIRVAVLVFRSGAFDPRFALAAAAGRAHGVLPVA
jgi:hypothetical protein